MTKSTIIMTISLRVAIITAIAIVPALFLAPSSVHAGILSRLTSFGTTEHEEAKDNNNNVGSIAVDENNIPFSILRNDSTIPLIGYGVGNLDHESVPNMVAQAIQSDKRTFLIDTSQVSGNEDLVARGILDGVDKSTGDGDDKNIQVHVITKIWYTHLGYERTRLAVEESLKAFESVIKSERVDLRIHFLLHWPRCFDHIPFMDCQGEEERLPKYVKDAGPDPSSDPEGAWKDSWKMLEDAYVSKQHPIESIGVSNFNLNHIEEMDSFARIRPGMIQVNLWSLLYDHKLIEYCQYYGIHVEVFNLMEGTLSSPEKAPHAYHHLQKVAIELSQQDDSTSDKKDITPAQVIFAWLIQHGVSVVTKTKSLERLIENSAVAVSRVPGLSKTQVETVAHAVQAYISGVDLNADIPMPVTFHAATKDMIVYWVTPVDEIKLALIRTGQRFNETSYPGHVYRFYDAQNKDRYVDHVVKPNLGFHETIHVDLKSNQLSKDTEVEKMMMSSSSSSSSTMASRTAQADNKYERQPGSVYNWLGGALQANKLL